MIVYVVAFETPESMGGHFWYFTPADADAAYKQEVEAKDYEIVVQFKAEVPDLFAPDELARESITNMIDAHCWQNTLAELADTTQDLVSE